ncbi:MAG: HD domain-containing phosphohydrolase, partial [Nitrospirota bacterium]
MNKNIINEILKRGEELSRSIAASAGYNFLSKDLLGLDNIVFKIKNSNKDVEYITIIGTDKKTIVHSDINQIGKILKYPEGQILKKEQDGTIVKEVHGMRGTIFEVVSPIEVMNKSFGTVILGINKSVLSNAQNATQKRIMGAFTATVFLGVIVSVILSSFLTRSIKELSSGVDELKQGKRIKPLMVYSEDELGRLTNSFNEMGSLITNQRDKLNEYARELEEAYVSTVKVLAAAIDAKDPYTHGHATRVSQLSLQLGREAGLGKEELQDLEIACLFHDVGKIRIPDKILRKKGRLREDEVIEMRR